MDNELMLQMNEQILITQGNVVFTEYEPLKAQALELAEHIQMVKVDEENIKKSKKLLAAVNNRVKELEDRRITIKKVMLQPYQQFEEQVKEIVGIVKAAEETVRQQVRDLEEQERFEKQILIEEMFCKRSLQYSFTDLFGFKDFIKPKHLNKTTSLNSIEKDLLDFFEKINRDLEVINRMPNAESILSHYVETKDLAAALGMEEQIQQRRREIEASQVMLEREEQVQTKFMFTVFDEKDAKLLRMFMEQNQINYSELKGEM
jgi:hypothetical protein